MISETKRCCGNCKLLSNVLEEERHNENVMGGCFFDGHFVVTDEPACKKFKKYEKVHLP